MAAAALYTMAPFEKLQGAGFTQPQACAILNAAIETHNTAELATKHDVEKLGMRLDRRIDKVCSEISDLRKDVGHLGSKLTIRLGAIVIGSVTLLPYLTKFLHLPPL